MARISSQELFECIYNVLFFQKKKYNKYKRLTIEDCKNLFDFYSLIIKGEVGKAARLAAELTNQFDIDRYVDKRILKFTDRINYDLNSGQPG